MSTNQPFNDSSGFDIQTNSGIIGDEINIASNGKTDFLDGHTHAEGAYIDPMYEQISKDMDGAEGSDNFEQANSVSDFPQILASEYQTEIPGVDTVLEWFMGASNKVGEFIDTHSPHVQEAAKNVVGTITSALSSLADRFSDRWNSPGNEIRSWVTQTVESATQSIRDGIEDFAETYGDDIQDFADSVSDKARQVLEEATDKTEVLFDQVFDQAGLTLNSNTVNQEDLVEIDGNQYKLSEYTIQEGDTLWDLAEETTGDGTNYDLIVKYNENEIEDPDVIYAGDTIKIPELVEQDAEQVLAQTPDTTGTVSSSSRQATEATTEPDSEISSTEASIKTIENEFLQVAAEYDLGEPISEIFTHAATESEFQYFDKPGLGTVAIVNSEHGTYPLWGDIRSHYLELGGLNSSLGAPTSPEFNWEGYTRQDFEGGYILWQGTATAYKSDGSLLYPTTNISLDKASSSGMSATVQYDGELVNLSSDDWDYYSSDNTRFDGAIWSGEVDERHLTPESVKQVYDGLSIALFGQRYKMTAGYLYDQSYFNGRGKWHAGIDIDAPDGTAVKAITGGEVAWVWEGGSSGDFIAIRGDDGREWVYGHLQDKGSFYAGMRVNTGDIVGAVGNQQYASHLHLEVRTGGGSTGGADANQAYVRDVTMSPLQAFWELQPEPKGSYEENFDAEIYDEGSDNVSSIQVVESLLDDGNLLDEQFFTSRYIQENEEWIVPKFEVSDYWPGSDSGGFNDWNLLRNVPGVEEVAQKAEDFLWHFFDKLGLETANKHMRHFLIQGDNPESITDVNVDDMLSALPVLKQELDARISDVQEKLGEYFLNLMANGEILEPNQIHYINPLQFKLHFVGASEEGENFWVNPKDGVSQPFSIMEEVPLKEPSLEALDYYNAINSFHYITEMQFQVKGEANPEIELRVKLHVHDHFNFDMKLPEDLSIWNIHDFVYQEVQALTSDFSSEEIADKGKAALRVAQSAIPELLVRLGMANNFEQFGESSEIIFRSKFQEDNIAWEQVS